MGMVARSDTFFLALTFWLYAPAYFLVSMLAGVAGVKGDDPIWYGLVGGFVVALFGAWMLLRFVPVFRRMSNKMSQWGVGVAQLTLIAYLVVMPVYFFICLFERDDHDWA